MTAQRPSAKKPAAPQPLPVVRRRHPILLVLSAAALALWIAFTGWMAFMG